jgi:hypothetical protein
MRRLAYIALGAALAVSACTAPETPRSNANAPTNTNAAGAPAAMTLTPATAPPNVESQRAQRGAQESASPTLRFLEPTDGATVDGSTVRVRLDLGGDLKGYEPHKDPATGMGNHIHVILDNQPYEAYYELGRPFELRNVSEGKHTLRVFASRPWHESYKNDGSFQMVEFTVRGGGDPSRPTTTNSGQTMADNRNAAATPPEGKDMAASQAGAVDRTKPLLTYSRPKGEYKGGDADPIMIDFWLTNAKLTGDGGQHRVRYSVDGGEPKFVEKWEPVWMKGWTAGKHTVKLELVDGSGAVVDNGVYNSTSREITVTP